MHDELWTGIEVKLQHAEFHLDQMGKSLQPPAVPAHLAAVTITNWQRPLYAHLDAFLTAVRSVPEIIQYCFGEDWGHSLGKGDPFPFEERERRHKFKEQFKATHDSFREHLLSKARDMSVHRTGYAPVKVMTLGFWAMHTGTPVERLPSAETRCINDGYGWMSPPLPIRPLPPDFRDNSFGPEDITKMSAAFEAALGKLGLVDRTNPEAVAVAKLIIEFAKVGGRTFCLAEAFPKRSPLNTKNNSEALDRGGFPRPRP